MAQSAMNDYRARKLENEYFEKSSFKRPCELLLKHGRSRSSYWGVPEIIKTSDKEIEGHKMSMVSVIWKTRRDQPVMFSLLLPLGMKFENVLTPRKYMETDRGYSNVISLVIGGLIAMNMLNFYLFATMADVGVEAFASPIFIGPVCAIMGTIIAAMRFNQTHFTYGLSLECFEPDMEPGKFHFCYAVDCDVQVHRQLWFETIPKLAKIVCVEHSKVLNEVYVDTRSQVGVTNRKIDDVLKDRKNESILSEDRATMMRAKQSIWDSPMTIFLIVGCITLLGALAFLLFGGR